MVIFILQYKVYQINMLYNLNSHNVIGQIYLNKAVMVVQQHECA